MTFRDDMVQFLLRSGATTPRDVQLLQREMATAGWSVAEEHLASLNAQERAFLEIECTGPRNTDYYIRRLKQLGVGPGLVVLDAGCGVGQWSWAMRALGAKVIGIDLNSDRLEVAANVNPSQVKDDVLIARASIERCPLRSQSVDVVFCYGTFMFADMEAAAQEFLRVLKPGGYVYVNANAIGWYLHLMIGRGLLAGDLSMAKTGLKYIVNAVCGREQMRAVEGSYMKSLLERHGFKRVAVGPEGSISVPSQGDATRARGFRRTSTYDERYLGAIAITEAVAFRPALSPPA